MPLVYGDWFQYDLGTSKVLGSWVYALGAYYSQAWAPEFKLLGSNDGNSWTELTTVSDGFSPTYRTITGTITGSYRYVRFILLKCQYPGYPTQLRTSFALYGPVNNILTEVIWRGYYDVNFSLTTSSQFSFSSWQNANIYGTGNFPLINIDSLSPFRYTAGTYAYTGTTSTSVGPDSPAAPESLSAVGGDQTVTVSFTPGSDGGSPIINYKYSLDNGTSFTEFDPALTAGPFVFTGLTNGTTYSIKLVAVNSLGDGAPSNTITATPHVVPDAPTNLVASYGGDGAVSISFTPGSDGGLAISNYQYSIDCGVTFIPLNPLDGISPVTIAGLTNGQTYCIELKAVNSAAGVASSSVEYTATGVPDAPTSISWTDVYNGRISVSFTPGSAEGLPILNYQYSLNGGSTFTALNPTASSSPITITGLTNRTDYSLALKAVNANGAGASSTPLPLYYMCFLEGTKILCYDSESKQEIERPVESLRKGDLVKTTLNGYMPIDIVGTSKIYNPANSMRSKNRLYKYSKENHPELNEDLVITGCHAVLVKQLSDEERRELIDVQGKVYATEDYYRLIACVDKRSQPYEKEGVFNIWHFALENENYFFNYGVYANGLKVETASKRMMKEMSGMDLIQ
jgi:hypothetical protein